MFVIHYITPPLLIRQALHEAEIDGMEQLMLTYGRLLTDFQKKGHDLLEYDNMGNMWRDYAIEYLNFFTKFLFFF